MMNKQVLILVVSTFIFFASAFPQHSGCNFLCNSDFEDQALVGPGSFNLFNQNSVACWSTTAPDGLIEVWGSGFNGVPAYSGIQFIELNANYVSTLYQDFTAALGSSVQISFAHRGRAGTDVMSVEIGPAGGPYVNLGTFSAGNTAWVYHTVAYTFPATGTANYTLRFNSISSAGGSSVGNFLDAITIELPQPSIAIQTVHPTCPQKANGAITATASGGTAPYAYQWLAPLNTADSVVTGLLEGNYTIEVTDFYGCRVEETATLTNQNAEAVINMNQVLCEGESYLRPNGAIVSQAGIYVDTVAGVDCDTIYIQNIIDGLSYHDTLDQNICDGESVSFHGSVYAQSGDYTVNYMTAQGCDSSFTLRLIVNSVFSDTAFANICENESYPFQGNTYNATGVYHFTYATIHGCDSAITLMLTVNPIHHDTITRNICSGEFYTLPDGTATGIPGTYSSAFLNTSGCDSLIVTFLDVLPTYADTLYDSVYAGEIYNGIPATESDIITNHHLSIDGCDSTVVIFLTVMLKPEIAIPSAFSPNGDGVNDVFRILGKNIAEQKLIIYNRWGERIFESGNLNAGWDGTHLGDPAEIGVYAYFAEIVFINRERKIYQGSVTLVR